MPDITIKTERLRVEDLLARYRTAIGSDYDGYRNHVYRAITYAMHFLNNALQCEQLAETAFLYHDIGLWTDHELAYLEPPEAVALEDVRRVVCRCFLFGVDPVTGPFPLDPQVAA